MAQLREYLDEGIIEKENEWRAILDTLSIPIELEGYDRWIGCGKIISSSSVPSQGGGVRFLSYLFSSNSHQEGDHHLIDKSNKGITTGTDAHMEYDINNNEERLLLNNQNGDNQGENGDYSLPLSPLQRLKLSHLSSPSSSTHQVLSQVLGKSYPFESGVGFTCGLWKLFHILLLSLSHPLSHSAHLSHSSPLFGSQSKTLWKNRHITPEEAIDQIGLTPPSTLSFYSLSTLLFYMTLYYYYLCTPLHEIWLGPL